jgi:hypothetical protein
MKKLITIVLLIFISNLSFGQTPLKKEGDFYELNDLWKRDSISVKQLIDKFNLDITKLETVQLFEQFDFAKKLQDEQTYTSYTYMLDKKTNTVKIQSIFHEGIKPTINKYVMIFCFDSYTDKKIINIQIF